MGLLTLYAGLLLPWLGGTLWLAYFDRRFGTYAVNRLRQAGYGFFLGYAVLFLAIQFANAALGSANWKATMLFLLFFSGAGGAALHFTRGESRHHPTPTRSWNVAQKTLVAVLLSWTVVHLVFMAIEVFTQPVYPWDAWLAWIYRAKAWFMAGGMVDVLGPAAWLKATAVNTYTIDAWTYPLLPSVVPYWSALSLGHWSETLINLPALFAGIAIGMALYGQCREYGLDRSASVVCCYLLYSIPLFGTHIALAGYADLWMAGFAGLGFISIMRGSAARRATANNRVHLVTGFFLLAMSIMVKNEGVVWLLASLLVLFVANVRTRTTLLLALVLALLVLLGFGLETTHVGIPVIGDFGFIDGRLVLPFIGSFRFEFHNIWKPYLDNFFIMGSWNLMGLLILAGLLLALQQPFKAEPDPARRTALSFIIVFIATQFFIFGMTDQGSWADRYTAINRLVLHFVPALLFAAAITFYSRLDASPGGRTTSAPMHGRTRISLLAGSLLFAAVIVVIGVWKFLTTGLPEVTPPAKTTPAAGLVFAFGNGHPVDNYMLVNGFANGYALLSSGPVSVRPAFYPALKYTWVPSVNTQEAAFFWRQKGEQNVSREDLPATGSALLDLASLPAWQSEITEFGFLLGGSDQQTVKIGAPTLEPDSLGLRLRLAWQGWTAFEEWSQQSINFLRGGGLNQPLSLPLLMTLYCLLAALALRIANAIGTSDGTRHWIGTSGALFLAAWMLLDVPWTANNVRQSRLSLENHLHVTREQRASLDLDGEIYRYVQHLKSDVLGNQRARVLILGGPQAVDYYLLRTKYHLLPLSALVTDRFTRKMLSANLDYVIYFGRPGSLSLVPGWNTRWRDSLLQVDSSQWGTVYRVDAD